MRAKSAADSPRVYRAMDSARNPLVPIVGSTLAGGVVGGMHAPKGKLLKYILGGAGSGALIGTLGTAGRNVGAYAADSLVDAAGLPGNSAAALTAQIGLPLAGIVGGGALGLKAHKRIGEELEYEPEQDKGNGKHKKEKSAMALYDFGTKLANYVDLHNAPEPAKKKLPDHEVFNNALMRAEAAGETPSADLFQRIQRDHDDAQKKEKSASSHISGMTYDPEHPNVKKLQREHPKNWRQVMAQSQGLSDASKASPVKRAASKCSPCDMPNGPTNKKHMTGASPAVLEADEHSEEIGKPKTTETTHEESVVSGKLAGFGAKVAMLGAGTVIGTLGGAVTGRPGQRGRAAGRGAVKGMGWDIGSAIGALPGAALGGMAGGLLGGPIGLPIGVGLGGIGGAVTGGMLGTSAAGGMLGPDETDEERFERLLAAREKATARSSAEKEARAFGVKVAEGLESVLGQDLTVPAGPQATPYVTERVPITAAPKAAVPGMPITLTHGITRDRPSYDDMTEYLRANLFGNAMPGEGDTAPLPVNPNSPGLQSKLRIDKLKRELPSAPRRALGKPNITDKFLDAYAGGSKALVNTIGKGLYQLPSSLYNMAGLAGDLSANYTSAARGKAPSSYAYGMGPASASGQFKAPAKPAANAEALAASSKALADTKAPEAGMLGKLDPMTALKYGIPIGLGGAGLYALYNYLNEQPKKKKPEEKSDEKDKA